MQYEFQRTDDDIEVRANDALEHDWFGEDWGDPRPRRSLAKAVWSWILTSFVDGFAAYATSMHPCADWQYRDAAENHRTHGGDNDGFVPTWHSRLQHRRRSDR
jgi:hypothetical protein